MGPSRPVDERACDAGRTRSARPPDRPRPDRRGCRPPARSASRDGHERPRAVRPPPTAALHVQGPPRAPRSRPPAAPLPRPPPPEPEQPGGQSDEAARTITCRVLPDHLDLSGAPPRPTRLAARGRRHPDLAPHTRRRPPRTHQPRRPAPADRGRARPTPVRQDHPRSARDAQHRHPAPARPPDPAPEPEREPWCEVALLGPQLQVTCGGQPLDSLTPTFRQLLPYLTTYRHGVTLNRIDDVIWP